MLLIVLRSCISILATLKNYKNNNKKGPPKQSLTIYCTSWAIVKDTGPSCHPAMLDEM